MKNAFNKLVDMFSDRADSMNVQFQVEVFPELTTLTHKFNSFYVLVTIFNDLHIELTKVDKKGNVFYDNKDITIKMAYDFIKNEHLLDIMIDS